MPDQVRLPASGLGSAAWWTEQLEWSADVRKDLLPQWRRLANAYRDELTKPRPEAIRVNIEYEKTEQKKHQLLYRLPALKLRPHPRTLRESGPNRDLRKAVTIFREVLTAVVGPKGANTKALMDEVLFDVLCPSGIAFAKIGYERYEDGTVPVVVGQEPDPAFAQPGSVLGLRPVPMVPVYGAAPNIVAERYYASRISPAKALVMPDFDRSDYCDADWLGHDFWILDTEAKRRGWKIPPDARRSSDDESDDRIVPVKRSGHRSKDQIHCREVFCYASRIYDDVIHPVKIRRLIFLVGGGKDPILVEDYKHQRFDARGRFIGGHAKLPIRVLTLRYVSDLAFPPSDCRISSQQGDELSEFRTQTIIHRRKAVPMRQINLERVLDEKVRELIKRGEYYEIIPTDSDQPIMQEMARAQYPRENYTANDYIMNDVNRLWALGANQAATRESAGTTATEIAEIRRATDSRMAAERDKVVNQFWIGLVEGLGELVQLYADREDVVEIVGQTGERSLEAWDRETIRGEFLFEAVPNSMVMPDAASDRDLALNRYNLLINDPWANREQLYRDTVEEMGGDPDRLTSPPAPPTQEKPRLNVSIKGEDLDPAAPQYGNVTRLLLALGIPATPVPQPQGGGAEGATGPAEVVDRERLRMAEADTRDGRAGGLVGMGR